MRDRQNIQDIRANDEVGGVYLIAASSLQQSRNGPYWRLDLRDATGNLEAKIWSPLSAEFSQLPPGSFAMVEGRASLFREQVQLTVDSLRLLSPEEAATLDVRVFMPSSPRNPADMLDELEALSRKVLTHKPWQKFVKSVLKDETIRAGFLTAPAAKSVHHAYCGGLLEHTLSVCGLCLDIADHYGGELDRQVLFCAAMFHDVGKIWELSGGLVNDYTDAGRMLGHIVQGISILEPYLIRSGVEEHLALHFRHLLASHHGQKEFGSPAVPNTAEAFVLHYADNIDAKVAQLRSLLGPGKEDAPGASSPTDTLDTLGALENSSLEWSPWNSLLSRQLARCPQTPAKRPTRQAAEAAEAESDKEQPKPKEDRQCSLL